VGSAVVRALRSRGHGVVEGARSLADGRCTMHVDFMQPTSPEAWSSRLAAQRIDAVVNCVGILMESRGQRFERIHAQGAIELFRGAVQAGVRRVVQVSALGVGEEDDCIATPYQLSKLKADQALAALDIDGAVLRPSLIYGPGSASAALFATLASLPVVSLPGRGQQRVQPIHVYELAEAAMRLLESPQPVRGVYELGGAEPVTYRRMLMHYRASLGLGEAIWLPVPMFAMRLTAWLAEALPQRVLSRDTIGMLERGNTCRVNAAPALLGRRPSDMARGLAVSPEPPLVDLRVRLAPPVALALRGSLAFTWLYVSLVSALLPAGSGVVRLLARCGFEGRLGLVVLVASCLLNASLGALTLLRPSPRLYALQASAVLGYTLMAAWHAPELTIDHCGPLVKNLPVLMTVLVLWLALPGRAGDRVEAATPARAKANASARIIGA
jgi:uncharacterized protein YbjT (DUF2867 family)